MKVLVIGHACGPGLGSEPSFTWETATKLAKHHQVWVIAHPQYRERVEGALLEQLYPNLNFDWVTPNTRFDPVEA